MTRPPRSQATTLDRRRGRGASSGGRCVTVTVTEMVMQTVSETVFQAQEEGDEGEEEDYEDEEDHPHRD